MFRQLAILMLCAITATTPIKEETTQPRKIRCTCYTANETARTASGQVVHKGIIAGKREWLQDEDLLFILYRVNPDGSKGDLIGYFECRDTGYGMKESNGKGSIQNGNSIDVFQPSLAECYEWVGEYGDYVYMEITRAQG